MFLGKAVTGKGPSSPLGLEKALRQQAQQGHRHTGWKREGSRNREITCRARGLEGKREGASR